MMKLQQCLDLLQNDDEEIVLREEDFLEGIPVETRRLAVDAALSDYRTGKCVSQNEMKGWMKERLGWKQFGRDQQGIHLLKSFNLQKNFSIGKWLKEQQTQLLNMPIYWVHSHVQVMWMTYYLQKKQMCD